MHAVVFSGGGAKGIYQAYEFIRQLEEGLAKPDIIYGTSVGSINAAGYAYNGAKIIDLWTEIRSRSDVMSLNWKFWSATGVYNTGPLRKLLEKKIRGRPLCRAATCHVDLITREISYVYNDKVSLPDFLDSVQASASIPFAMSPIGTKVDGGVREVTPLLRAIEDGAEMITVFLCNPYSKESAREQWTMPSSLLPALGIGVRAIEIMEHEIFLNDIQTCLYYNKIPGKKKIKLRVFNPRPEDMFINTLDFDPVKIRRVIDQDIRMEDSLSRMNKRTLRKVA